MGVKGMPPTLILPHKGGGDFVRIELLDRNFLRSWLILGGVCQ